MRTKPAANHSKNFSTKLAAYSATATAALLATPMAADATIQDLTTFGYNNGSTFGTFPPRNVGNSNTGFTVATANHKAGLKGGVLDVSRVFSASSSRFNIHMKIGGASANHIAGAGGFASNLGLGISIAGKNFAGGNNNLAQENHFHSTYNSHINLFGNFLPHGANAKATGYIGFKTNLRGHTYYGWLRVQVANNAFGDPSEVSLVAKAGDPGIYGAFGLPGDDIKAGEIAPVPEPSAAAIGGLGLLALGAAGVREMRRRRKASEKI